MRWGVVPLLALHAAASAAGTCPVEGVAGFERVAGDRAVVLYRPEPEPLAVGTGFELDVYVCRASGEPFTGELSVDAMMPAHGHGMNYRTEVEPAGPGRYRVRGMLLHMPGHWELRFGLRGEGGVERLTTDLGLR